MNSISRYPNDMALPYRPLPHAATFAEPLLPRPGHSGGVDNLLSQFTSQTHLGQSSRLLQHFLRF